MNTTEPKSAPAIDSKKLELLQSLLTPAPASLNEEQIQQIHDRIVEQVKATLTPEPVHVTVTAPSGKVTVSGEQHHLFPDLLDLLSEGELVFLTGGPGSGKTTAVEEAAKALELPFYSLSLSAQTGTHALLGYQDAHGRFVSTDFRRAFEDGGVFCLDEVDNGNPNVLAVLNTALANGHCSFADGMVARHADFRLVATGNTVGRGGSAQFVGRNPIDAATLDRFAMIHWDYDMAFEQKLAGDPEWTGYVQSIRSAAESLGSKLIVSPRASMKGAKMRRKGWSKQKCADAYIWKGLSQDERRKIEAALA